MQSLILLRGSTKPGSTSAVIDSIERLHQARIMSAVADSIEVLPVRHGSRINRDDFFLWRADHEECKFGILCILSSISKALSENINPLNQLSSSLKACLSQQLLVGIKAFLGEGPA